MMITPCFDLVCVFVCGLPFRPPFSFCWFRFREQEMDFEFVHVSEGAMGCGYSPWQTRLQLGKNHETAPGYSVSQASLVQQLGPFLELKPSCVGVGALSTQTVVDASVEFCHFYLIYCITFIVHFCLVTVITVTIPPLASSKTAASCNTTAWKICFATLITNRAGSKDCFHQW